MNVRGYVRLTMRYKKNWAFMWTNRPPEDETSENDMYAVWGDHKEQRNSATYCH